jgi:hypothetical protein
MTDSLTKTVHALEERLWQAQRESNVAELDLLLADDALFTGIDGQRETKASDLEQHRSGALKITKLEPLEFALREIPSGAITSVKMAGTAIIQGQQVVATLYYTRVWIQRDGRWQIVGAHITAAPP